MSDQGLTDKTLAKKTKQIENLKKQIEALELKKKEKTKYSEIDAQIQELKDKRDSLKTPRKKKTTELNVSNF